MRRRGWIFPGLLGLAFLFSLGSVLWPDPVPVDDAAWGAAESIIAEQGSSGDMVIVHPVWEHGATRHFQKHVLVLGRPNVDSHLSYPYVWLVLAHGASTPGYMGDFELGFEKTVGPLRVLRYARPDAADVRYDFFVSVEDAKVELQRGKDVQPCNEFRLMRYYCPRRDWNYFGQRAVFIQGEMQNVLWMHPLRGWTTRARYRNLRLSDRLMGRYALADPAIDANNKTPVRFRILINGRQVGDYHSEQKKGWQPFDIDTSRFKGSRMDVVFEVTAAKDGMRHFCWLAQLRGDDDAASESGASDAASESGPTGRIQATPDRTPATPAPSRHKPQRKTIPKRDEVRP